MSERIATEVDGVALSLTNLEKALFPDGFTKSELISYYLKIAEVMLPHLAERAITRVRYPEGTAKGSFFEKNAPQGSPEWVGTTEVATSAGSVRYVVVDQRATLVWLANLASIELHAPQWRLPDTTTGDDGIVLDGADEPRATTLVVDLDPGPGITPADSARAAIVAATVLAELGLEAQIKASGNKGLQLSVPLEPTPASQVFHFAQSLARHLAATQPKLFTATLARDARAGLVFVDFAQNLAARNTVCAYSVRGLDRPSVAVPLTWEEVAALRPDSVLRTSPAEALARVQAHGDLWSPLLPYGRGTRLPDPID